MTLAPGVLAGLAALAVPACSSSSSEAPPPRPEPGPPIASASDAAPATPTPPPTAAGPIPARSRVLLTSVTPNWSEIHTQVTLWRRDDATAPWRTVRSWPATIGRTGLAWGDGLHGGGAPAGRTGAVKREGDGKSPAGVFTLDASYGYAPQALARAALPYTQVDPSWLCIDDPKSKSYNRIIDTDGATRDWESSEEMRRDDVLYTWVVDVGHNRGAKPGAGSCIFLHVWGGPDDATAGCTAMAKPAIEALLKDLDPAQAPVMVQLPRAEYEALAAAWQLPARAVESP